MVKKKKKDILSQVVEKILNKAEGIIDKIGMRDLIYALSYFSAVYIAYETCMKAKALIGLIPGPLEFFKLIGGMALIPIVAGSELTEEQKLNPECLTISFVAAYMVLKIDIQDISSAIQTLSGVVAKFG